MHLVSWDKVISLLFFGGLRFTTPKLRNKDLLSKWIWRYIMEIHALCRRVIAAKFGSSICDTKTDSCSLSISKGPCKAIFILQPLVDQHVVVTLGNGHSDA